MGNVKSTGEGLGKLRIFGKIEKLWEPWNILGKSL